ncbi:MAG: hypothetical protein QOJ65_574 [Fimbriimonadaceae bacterium]|jgi:CBS domain-containing protein|nr:hypothetical protein [Fimbriimonadaceae bacterium]
MQQTTSLGKPVASMMRPIPRVWPTATVGTAAAEIRDSGLPAVAVTEGYMYVGLVTQASLAAAMAQGIQPADAVEMAFDTTAIPLPPYAPGERALEILSGGQTTAIPVVDDYGRLMGVVTPADLYPKRDRPPHPGMVGGMATPFGVYLTTGTIRAGASNMALVTTGMVLFTSLMAANIIGGYAATFSFHHGWRIPSFAFDAFIYLLFLGTFRLLPLSGIHGAEHKVVHAIERGEELTRENVRRMPRVHPRCGTNFAVGASLFMGIAAAKWLIPLGDFQPFVALVATLIFWRPIGSLVQYWVTTKEPTDKQLDMGIRSGEELLHSYASGQTGSRSLPARIWNSGMLHVISGSVFMLGVMQAVNSLFKLNLPLY